MPEEIKPPVRPPQPIRGIKYARPPRANEANLWSRLLSAHKDASKWLDVAGLLLTNIYITYRFASENGVTLPQMDPALERKYYDARDSFDLSRKAIRGVIDRRYGIKITGNDLDILEPKPEEGEQSVEGFGGFIIPIIIGVVILAGAVGAAIWQSRVAQEVANKYRKLLFDTNAIFCADPNSELCAKWEAYKQKHSYNKHETLAESIKKGIRSVGGGIGKAVFLIGAVFALTTFWRKTR